MASSEEIRFRAGDASLAGTITAPDGSGPFPWAVLVPSWLPRTRDGGWDRERHPGWYAPLSARGILARLADALAAHGVASLRYDPRGCGASDGAWESTALFTRIDDVRDAIGAMRSRRELDMRRAALVGHGEGGILVLSAAIGDPAIGAVALIGSPARSFRDVLRRGAAERWRTGTDREHPIVDAIDRSSDELIERAERREAEATISVADETVTLRLAAWEQAIHTPALALATMLHRNVVVAYGETDAWVHPDESRLLVEVLVEAGNEPRVAAVDGAGHDLVEAPDETIDSIAAALAERIEPRDLPPVLVAIEEMRRDG